MFGRSGALAALALAATGGFGLVSGASKSAREDVVILGPSRRSDGRPKRLRFVDRTRYPGHVLREIRSSTERQARECARRRRQAAAQLAASA